MGARFCSCATGRESPLEGPQLTVRLSTSANSDPLRDSTAQDQSEAPIATLKKGDYVTNGDLAGKIGFVASSGFAEVEWKNGNKEWVLSRSLAVITQDQYDESGIGAWQEGDTVKVREDFQSGAEGSPVLLASGWQGTVEKIIQFGIAIVFFENLDTKQWIKPANFAKLEVVAKASVLQNGDYARDASGKVGQVGEQCPYDKDYVYVTWQGEGDLKLVRRVSLTAIS